MVELLLKPPARPTGAEASRGGARPLVAAVSTFPVHPCRGGGQVRCFHLLSALTARFDVELVSLVPHGETVRRLNLRPGLAETLVPKSAEHELQERQIAAAVGLPVTDVVAPILIDRTPEFAERLHKLGAGAAAAVLEHPYLQPALAAALPGVPVVLDAHNAEFILKGAVLGSGATGLRLLEETRTVEAAAVGAAVLVAACAASDADALCAEYGGAPARFLVVPNGVDGRATAFVGGKHRRRRRDRRLEALGRARRRPSPSHAVLFMGSWHPPNVEAAQRIVAVSESLPEVAFLMVGSHCIALDGKVLPDNMVLYGEVSDALKRSLLWSADLGLNPVIRGSGTNLKLVEYFAAGLPVLSTPFGTLGIEVSAEHLWIAALDEFAGAVPAALQRADEGAAMAKRARRLVDEEFDWTVIGARYCDAVARVLA